jgi:carbonic anhydrase
MQAMTSAPADLTARIADATDFADVLAANETYAERFALKGLPAVAAKGLAVVTCMDSRIEPLTMLGIEPGDAKILRNAGARVTDDVLRTLVLAVHLLEVDRAMVVAHTRCKMAQTTDAALQETLAEQGLDARALDFHLISDQEATLRADVAKVDAWPFLRSDVVVGGFIYDVDTGRLSRIC